MIMAEKFIRKTFGITGTFGEIFNAVGASARMVSNIASGGAEFTESLPELGADSGQLMSVKAKQALTDQRSLLEST
jgi:hypothetical protein